MYARIHQPGAIHHLITRCAGRAFRIEGAVERREYLQRAALALRGSDCIPLSYALMTNHIHWMVVAGEQRLADFSQRLHSPYAAWLNIRQHSIGPVFTERFKQIVFSERDALSLIAYIHNNPVRAGVVESAADSDWTSHQYYLAPRTAPPWLAVELGLSLAGTSTPEIFDAAVESAKHEPKNAMWSGGRDRAHRTRTRVAVGSAVEVSGPRIGLERSSYDVVVRPNATLFVKRDLTADQVVAMVAALENVDVSAICSRIRTRPVVHARRLALLAWRRCAQKQSEMAAVLGLSQSAASTLVTTGLASTTISQAVDRVMDALNAPPAAEAPTPV